MTVVSQGCRLRAPRCDIDSRGAVMAGERSDAVKYTHGRFRPESLAAEADSAVRAARASVISHRCTPAPREESRTFAQEEHADHGNRRFTAQEVLVFPPR